MKRFINASALALSLAAAPVQAIPQESPLDVRPTTFKPAAEKVDANSFDTHLLRDQAEHIRTALTEQGKLGHVYIDPRPYKACEDGASDVQGSPAANVKAMEKCAGCVYRTAADRCQVYNRAVVAEVAEADLVQEALLNPPERAPFPEPELDPSVEFDLDGGLGAVDVYEAPEANDYEVSFEDLMGELE